MIFNLIVRSIKRYKGFLEYALIKLRNELYSNKKYLLPMVLRSRKDFDNLFEVFFEENKRCSILDGTRVVYPGRRSRNGADMDAIEGCSRFMPMAAAFLRASQGSRADISNVIKNSLIQGTRKGRSYWGKTESYDQLVVEMSDIALAIWLSKDFVWVSLSKDDKKRISDWLKLAINEKVFDNNWLLFVLLIEFVLKDLGEVEEVSDDAFCKVKSFYRGNGWFEDGVLGGIDYYNAWAFNYSFYWISQIDPLYEKDFIIEVISSFSSVYKKFFDSNGIFPMYGRSVCYRMAAYAPLLTGSDLVPSIISPVEAGNLLSRGWEYFIKNGAVDNGRITQGFFCDDSRFLDNYSGPASPLWSLRSLIVAYYIASKGQDPFQVSEERIEVKFDGYDFEIKNIGLRVIGSAMSGKVTLILPSRKDDKCASVAKRYLKLLLFLSPIRKTKYRDSQSIVIDSNNDFYR